MRPKPPISFKSESKSVGLVWLKHDVLKVMCQLMCQLMCAGTCACVPAYVQSCAEWIVILQSSDFRFALFVFALLPCDCCIFAWLRASIYMLLLRCCFSCFATPVQPGCFECLLFCLQHISRFVDRETCRHYLRACVCVCVCVLCCLIVQKGASH